MSEIVGKRYQLTLTLIRVVLGFVILAQAVEKLFSYFSTHGFTRMDLFIDPRISPAFAVTIIFIECLAMVALMFGLFTRVLSTGVILIAAGSMLSPGFFGWQSMIGTGYQFLILVMILASVPLIKGGGIHSLDHIIHRGVSALAFQR